MHFLVRMSIEYDCAIIYNVDSQEGNRMTNKNRPRRGNAKDGKKGGIKCIPITDMK